MTTDSTSVRRGTAHRWNRASPVLREGILVRVKVPRVLAMTALALGGLVAGLLVNAPEAAAASTTLYVAAGGTNTGTCTSSGTPCATVTYAVSQAASGDTIDVAGTIDDHVTVGDFSALTLSQWPGHSPAVLDGTSNGRVLNAVASNVSIDQLTIEGGMASSGAGVSIEGGTVTVSDSTIANNTASGVVGDGGGIFLESGTLAVADSTIANNSASGSGSAGGGIFLEGGTVTVTDTTIANNTSTVVSSNAVGSGGGIFNENATVAVTDSTIANNSAVSGGGGISGDFSRTTTLGATIIANNTGGNCFGTRIKSAGYNLTNSAGTKCGLATSTHDIVNANPELGSLQNNGGPTQTMAPAPGSPATGAIPLNTTLNGTQVCPGTDQRGVSRPQPSNGTACSIGAVEVTPDAAPTITSPDTATFTVGKTAAFQVTTTGRPAPTVSEAGPLPHGLILSPGGTLSGTPAKGTVGIYPITITANNGLGTVATQSFSVVVAQAPIPTQTPLVVPVTITPLLPKGINGVAYGTTVRYRITVDNTTGQDLGQSTLAVLLPGGPPFVGSGSVSLAATGSDKAKWGCFVADNTQGNPYVANCGAGTLPKGTDATFLLTGTVQSQVFAQPLTYTVTADVAVKYLDSTPTNPKVASEQSAQSSLNFGYMTSMSYSPDPLSAPVVPSGWSSTQAYDNGYFALATINLSYTTNVAEGYDEQVRLVWPKSDEKYFGTEATSSAFGPIMSISYNGNSQPCPNFKQQDPKDPTAPPTPKPELVCGFIPPMAPGSTATLQLAVFLAHSNPPPNALTLEMSFQNGHSALSYPINVVQSQSTSIASAHLAHAPLVWRKHHLYAAVKCRTPHRSCKGLFVLRRSHDGRRGGTLIAARYFTIAKRHTKLLVMPAHAVNRGLVAIRTIQHRRHSLITQLQMVRVHRCRPTGRCRLW